MPASAYYSRCTYPNTCNCGVIYSVSGVSSGVSQVLPPFTFLPMPFFKAMRRRVVWDLNFWAEVSLHVTISFEYIDNQREGGRDRDLASPSQEEEKQSLFWQLQSLFAERKLWGDQHLWLPRSFVGKGCQGPSCIPQFWLPPIGCFPCTFCRAHQCFRVIARQGCVCLVALVADCTYSSPGTCSLGVRCVYTELINTAVACLDGCVLCVNAWFANVFRLRELLLNQHSAYPYSHNSQGSAVAVKAWQLFCTI